jgi:hypothetical protein
MEREIVKTWHHHICPVGTGEEYGEAYCVCFYVEKTITSLARLVLNACECDSSMPEMKCEYDLAADIINNEALGKLLDFSN